ncbi:hypothetical protein [Streptomyces acidicola]|uniref:hypothetical protein n=1 Tax=Streptomyces acidicola TaxID=2596892 RepID=UPI0038036F6D
MFAVPHTVPHLTVKDFFGILVRPDASISHRLSGAFERTIHLCVHRNPVRSSVVAQPDRRVSATTLTRVESPRG